MIKIAKSDLTIKLEREIWKATRKQGVFGCFEVTIGWFGKERVDYITYDTSGIWRCYEIKVSKADFNSIAKLSFLGHYNYYVMTRDLYDLVKNEIPKNIGVYVGSACVKRSKRQELGVDEQILKNSMIRSLAREYQKQYDSGIPSKVEYLRRENNRLRSERQKYYRDYYDLRDRVVEKHGWELVRS